MTSEQKKTLAKLFLAYVEARDCRPWEAWQTADELDTTSQRMGLLTRRGMVESHKRGVYSTRQYRITKEGLIELLVG